MHWDRDKPMTLNRIKLAMPRSGESSRCRTRYDTVSMERVCFLLRVRPGMLPEYKRRHERVWPEMLQALTEAGWRNYSLFLRQDGLLIGYLETDNFEESLRLMAATDVNERWQREMKPFFAHTEGRADEALERVEEVFHLA